ncbi:MAG TPA: hypothetical protein VIH22_18560 [Cyclobacteriaceae bacterium]
MFWRSAGGPTAGCRSRAKLFLVAFPARFGQAGEFEPHSRSWKIAAEQGSSFARAPTLTPSPLASGYGVGRSVGASVRNLLE